VIVLIAERQAMLGAGTASILRQSAVEAVAVDTVAELVMQLEDQVFDVVLIDWDLGADAITRARARTDAPIVVWAAEPTSEIVLRATVCGARGVLPKETTGPALAAALDTAAHGGVALTPAVAGMLLDAIHQLGGENEALVRARVLSDRERDVLRLVAAGFRNREIAAELTISEFTVKRHIQNILEKLRLHSRHDAASFYRAAFPRSLVSAASR
jgi:DNA-binding NarL/FixJ family response regulator